MVGSEKNHFNLRHFLQLSSMRSKPDVIFNLLNYKTISTSSTKKRSKERERISVISASNLPRGNSSALSRIKNRPEIVFADHPSHSNALSIGYLTNTIVTKVTPPKKRFLNYYQN